MALWQVRNFGGTQPATHPWDLPDPAAQAAIDCQIKSGRLEPLPARNTLATGLAIGVEILYKHATGAWLYFSDAYRVVKGAVFNDDLDHIYYTDNTAEARYSYTGLVATQSDRPLGVPAPSTAPSVVVNGDSDPADIPDSRVYLFTYVVQDASLIMEGAPSPPSAVVDVYPGQSCEVTLPAVENYGNPDHAKVRIYRSVSGEYLFVAERAATIGMSVIFTDTLSGDALAEPLPTLDYATPPDKLDGLTAMANGVMAGFVGQDIYFSEPYLPHAWPVGYSQSVDAEIVALAAFGSSLIVLTTDKPYQIMGTHPSTMAMNALDVPQACVSRRSVVEGAGGVIYASPDGLFLMGAAAPVNLLEGVIDSREWRYLKPETLLGVVYEGRYFGFFDTGSVNSWVEKQLGVGETRGCFILDLATRSLTWSTLWVYAALYESEEDTLYLHDYSGDLVEWVPDNAPANAFTWRSKRFYSSVAHNMGAARVEALGYTDVTFTLYGDGVERYTYAVPDSAAFRLPSGYRAQEWELVVQSTTPVEAVYIASSMSELVESRRRG